MWKPLAIFLGCAALAGSAHAAMSDAEFLELCSVGSAPRLEIALEQGANVEAKDEDGVTALMRVARDNFHPAVLHVLLNAGADADARDKEGRRAIDFLSWRRTMRGTNAMKRLDAATSHIQ